MPLPTLTAEQRAEALAKATEARKARSVLLAAVKAGEMTVADVLDKADTDEITRKTKVAALVKALPGVGAVKATQLLADLAIADGRRIGGLGANQREALVAATS